MHLESGSGLYVEEKEERLLKPEIAGDTKDKASSLQNWNKKKYRFNSQRLWENAPALYNV